MHVNRVVAGVCAVAGIWILTGPGWALLVASGLLLVLPESGRVSAMAAVAGSQVRAAWRWVVGSKRSVAVATMPGAVVLVPLGLGITFGAGIGVAVLGAMLGAVSLLTGWNVG